MIRFFSMASLVSLFLFTFWVNNALSSTVEQIQHKPTNTCFEDAKELFSQLDIEPNEVSVKKKCSCALQKFDDVKAKFDLNGKPFKNVDIYPLLIDCFEGEITGAFSEAVLRTEIDTLKAVGLTTYDENYQNAEDFSFCVGEESFKAIRDSANAQDKHRMSRLLTAGTARVFSTCEARHNKSKRTVFLCMWHVKDVFERFNLNGQDLNEICSCAKNVEGAKFPDSSLGWRGKTFPITSIMNCSDSIVTNSIERVLLETARANRVATQKAKNYAACLAPLQVELLKESIIYGVTKNGVSKLYVDKYKSKLAANERYCQRVLK